MSAGTVNVAWNVAECPNGSEIIIMLPLTVPLDGTVMFNVSYYRRGSDAGKRKKSHCLYVANVANIKATVKKKRIVICLHIERSKRNIHAVFAAGKAHAL